MAIVKHQVSKNADYGHIFDYYTLKHQEVQGPHGMIHKPVLDDLGFTQPRDNYAVCYISANGEEKEPELWQSACIRTNMLFKKNQAEGDRKSHEYIISHPEEDRPLMSMDDLVEEGRKFAQTYFKGYDVLIAVHRDTDNDHIHISINSVRTLELDREEPWMAKDKFGKVKACEMVAGGKHQQGPLLLRNMNDWLWWYSKQHGYAIEDNNAKSDSRKEKHHGSKNDQMKQALLDAAGRSQNMKDLQRILKTEYDMDLTIRGETLSIKYPGADKAVRLRTLGLDPAELTRLMNDTAYEYTMKAEKQQIQKEVEAEEKKKYIEWIKERRRRNNERAETAILKAETALAASVKARGERYNKADFGSLLYLVNQTFYLAGDLLTEKDKINRLLERWEKYRALVMPAQERRKHAGYVRWCGCDPDSELEFADLKAELEIIDAQIQSAFELNTLLRDTQSQWKGHNELERSIERADKDIEYAKDRKRALKNRLRDVKASRKKLWEIYRNCLKARSFWDIFDAEKMAKVDYFYGLWHEKVQKEKEIQKKIRDAKKQQKEAKERQREAKRQTKGETYSR